MSDSFYVVWQPESGNPRVRHACIENATREAERLARENPGRQFFVLAARSVSQKIDVHTTTLFEPLPF